MLPVLYCAHQGGRTMNLVIDVGGKQSGPAGTNELCPDESDSTVCTQHGTHNRSPFFLTCT